MDEHQDAERQPVDPRRMAAARLHGVLDAAVRDPLTPSQLVGVAGRAQATTATAIERRLLDTLPIADLTTVGMTAINFVLQALAPVATVQGATRAAERRPDAKTLQRATCAMRATADALTARLQALPNANELERLGDLIERGQHCGADLAIVRAIPGPYLRAQATSRHFALFADYRQWDR